MAPVIHQINVRSWSTLVLSILKAGLLRTGRPTKDRRHDPATRNKFNIQKDNNDIVNHAVDEILLQENNKVSAESEIYENI